MSKLQYATFFCPLHLIPYEHFDDYTFVFFYLREISNVGLSLFRFYDTKLLLLK